MAVRNAMTDRIIATAELGFCRAAERVTRI
jgi:hypothetical protein